MNRTFYLGNVILQTQPDRCIYSFSLHQSRDTCLHFDKDSDDKGWLELLVVLQMVQVGVRYLMLASASLKWLFQSTLLKAYRNLRNKILSNFLEP